MRIKLWLFALIGIAVSMLVVSIFFLTVVEKVAIKNIVEQEQALLEHQAELMASNLSHGDIEQVKNWATLTAELQNVRSTYVVSREKTVIASNTISHEGKQLLDVDSAAFIFLGSDKLYNINDYVLYLAAPVL